MRVHFEEVIFPWRTPLLFLHLLIDDCLFWYFTKTIF